MVCWQRPIGEQDLDTLSFAMTMVAKGLDHLPGRLLLDGGMGTALMNRGLELGREPTDAWNVTHPEVVTEIHRSFIDAGAAAVQTNTFGANRVRLHSFGRAGDVREHNLAGAAAARAAAAPETI